MQINLGEPNSCPTRERGTHDPITRGATSAFEVKGALVLLHERGVIDDDQLVAGLAFRERFQATALDGLKALDTTRPPIHWAGGLQISPPRYQIGGLRATLSGRSLQAHTPLRTFRQPSQRQHCGCQEPSVERAILDRTPKELPLAEWRSVRQAFRAG